MGTNAVNKSQPSCKRFLSQKMKIMEGFRPSGVPWVITVMALLFLTLSSEAINDMNSLTQNQKSVEAAVEDYSSPDPPPASTGRGTVPSVPVPHRPLPIPPA